MRAQTMFTATGVDDTDDGTAWVSTDITRAQAERFAAALVEHGEPAVHGEDVSDYGVYQEVMAAGEHLEHLAVAFIVGGAYLTFDAGALGPQDCEAFMLRVRRWRDVLIEQTGLVATNDNTDELIDLFASAPRQATVFFTPDGTPPTDLGRVATPETGAAADRFAAELRQRGFAVRRYGESGSGQAGGEAVAQDFDPYTVAAAFLPGCVRLSVDVPPEWRFAWMAANDGAAFRDLIIEQTGWQASGAALEEMISAQQAELARLLEDDVLDDDRPERCLDPGRYRVAFTPAGADRLDDSTAVTAAAAQALADAFVAEVAPFLYPAERGEVRGAQGAHPTVTYADAADNRIVLTFGDAGAMLSVQATRAGEEFAGVLGVWLGAVRRVTGWAPDSEELGDRVSWVVLGF